MKWFCSHYCGGLRHFLQLDNPTLRRHLVTVFPPKSLRHALPCSAVGKDDFTVMGLILPPVSWQIKGVNSVGTPMAALTAMGVLRVARVSRCLGISGFHDVV